MIEVPDVPVVGTGPTSQVPITLSSDHPSEALVVTISRSAPGGEKLLGRWTFENPGTGEKIVNIDWLASGAGLVSLSSPGGGLLAPEHADHDPGAAIWPDMTLRLIRGPESAEVALKVTEPKALERYYRQEEHQDEYVVEHPFFLAFHAARLRVLGNIFRKYIRPGSRVLDVGSGYSIFFLVGTDWDFEISCCDLDSAAMEKMRSLVPGWDWVVADALSLPWEDGSFDVVYAGEIIEHLPDPQEALAEWKRILAPGGILILTTPNRDRLLSRTNEKAMPVHHEHVSELNLPEVEELLKSEGFQTIKLTGIYLEVAQNWWRPRGNRVDELTARLNKPSQRPLYRPFMELGRLAPSRAYDLVFVCVFRPGS
ncbi:MAG: class I SAM-dependent methyltransferase [Actinobacteria bacterium]|nr:class I SAM-dependent methyltransferase [Actinomycetota bacterium]